MIIFLSIRSFIISLSVLCISPVSRGSWRKPGSKLLRSWWRNTADTSVWCQSHGSFSKALQCVWEKIWPDRCNYPGAKPTHAARGLCFYLFKEAVPVQVASLPACKRPTDRHLAQACINKTVCWVWKWVLAWGHVRKANSAIKYLWPQKAFIPLKAETLQFKVWSI